LLTKILILILIFLLPMIPTFWAIIDVAHKPFQSFQLKVIWFAIVTLMPVIGAVIYFFYGRKKYTISITNEQDSRDITGKKE